MLSAPPQAVPGCTLELGAGPIEYDHCLPIDGIGSGFWLLWSMLPSSNGANLVRWGMNSSASGYVAFAYPPDPEPDTGGCWGQVAGNGREVGSGAMHGLQGAALRRLEEEEGRRAPLLSFPNKTPANTDAVPCHLQVS